MTICRALFLSSLTIFCLSCSTNKPKPLTYFQPGNAWIPQGLGTPRPYRLEVSIGFEKKPLYSQWIAMDLTFNAWREEAGHRFVLEKQNRPSYTLFTYFKGIFNKTFNADVKTLVEITEDGVDPRKGQDMARAETRGREALDIWRKSRPQLAARYNWVEDPKIIYYSPERFRGRFGFYRSHRGTLVLEAGGQIRSGTVVNNVSEIYRWHEKDKPDPIGPANFFRALSVMLSAYDTSPFPDEDPGIALEDAQVGDSWKTNNQHSIQAMIGAVLQINANLEQFLANNQQSPFSMTYRLTQRDGEVDQIESEVTDFGKSADLGEGYQLLRYRRTVVYDRGEQIILQDTAHLEAAHSNGDKISMRIQLKAGDQ